MTNRQPTRAELIDRLATSSKEAVVLEEMQRFGFWPQNAGKPALDAELLGREAELVCALSGLQHEVRQHNDQVRALRAMRKARMAKARALREEKAQARERQRHERAVRWFAERQQQSGYLGAGVSGGLQAASAKAARAADLPAVDTPLALAEAMGITLAELKFLSFHRSVATTTHYRRFALPKKTGGERLISAPMPRLKRAQYWVLDNLLAKVPCHEAVHGFLPGRSIVTNAAPHCGQSVVINLDLKDFFPSVGYPRIKGVFEALGYPESVATVLALLCSENVADALEVDGETFYVGGEGRDRVLPQGAPTSPMLTNILCRRLDRRLQGLASKLGFIYTRYADDLTFSATGDGEAPVGRLLRQVHHVVKDEGFTPHPDKQHVMRSGARQEVTGIVVNQGPSVSRTERRALRAALHRAQTRGVEQATWQGQQASRDTLLGYAQFVRMVNAAQGAPLLARARALPATSAAAVAHVASTFRERSARGEAPLRAQGAWWTPAAGTPPQLQLTAAQIKAQRQKKREQDRVQRKQAARVAGANQATGTDADSVEVPVTGNAPRHGGLTAMFAVQALVMLGVAARGNTPVPLLVASLWLGWALYSGKSGIWRYLWALLVVGWLALRH